MAEQSGEDDDETITSHRFNSGRQSTQIESRDRTRSRNSNKHRENERLEQVPLDSSRQDNRKPSTQQSNSRRSKDLAFRSPSESDSKRDNNDFRNTSPSRTRESNNNDQTHNSHPQSSRTRGSSRSDARSRGNIENGKAKKIEETERRSSTNERRPTSRPVSSEDVTFPSRSKSRQSQSSREEPTNYNRSRLRSENVETNNSEILLSDKKLSRISGSKSKSRTGSVLNQGQERNFARNQNVPNADFLEQDVESKNNGRRRTLVNEQVNLPDFVSSNDGNEGSFRRERVESVDENVFPDSSSAPILTEPVISTTEHTILQSPVEDNYNKKYRNGDFNSRSRVRTSPNKNDRRLVNGNSRQRTKETNQESEVPTQRSNIRKSNFEQRDQTNIDSSSIIPSRRKSVQDQNFQDIQDSFRHRNGKLPSRQSSFSEKSDETDNVEPNSRDNEAQEHLDILANSKNLHENDQGSDIVNLNNRRKAVAQSEKESITPKPPRSRGHVRQGTGKRNENEVK